MALNTRHSNFLLLLVSTICVHHVLSQTTDSSLSESLTTISDLTTFSTSTIVVSNSTIQLTSTTPPGTISSWTDTTASLHSFTFSSALSSPGVTLSIPLPSVSTSNPPPSGNPPPAG